MTIAHSHRGSRPARYRDRAGAAVYLAEQPPRKATRIPRNAREDRGPRGGRYRPAILRNVTE
ncbi:hypothetical protein GCM10010231_66390 [Streptomyces sindenensis]|nr:hypothetical protein GCM10010231_66390 [Streptomyces sindenensis]